MKVLDIDAGNTRVKWRLLVDGSTVSDGAFFNAPAEDIAKNLSSLVPADMNYCRLTSVRTPVELKALCGSLFEVLGVQPILPNPQSGIGGVTFLDADPKGSVTIAGWPCWVLESITRIRP